MIAQSSHSNFALSSNEQGHDDSFESSNPDSKSDLMYKWYPYLSINNVQSSEQMQQYNYPTADTFCDLRSTDIYHSGMFSPETGLNVKRASRYDPSKEFLPAPNPDLSSNYCCCKSKRQCIKITILVIALSALSLGLLLFFCWPRIPVFTVSETYSDLKGLEFSSTNAYYDPLLALKKASIAVPFRASFSFSVPVIVNSSNYIDISVNSIVISAKILNANQRLTLDGRGEMLNIIISKQTSTPMAVYVVITSPDQVRNVDLCIKSTDSLKMVLTTRLAIQPLEFLNVYPSFTNQISVKCMDSFVELSDLFTKNLIEFVHDCSIDDQTKIWSSIELNQLIYDLDQLLPISKGQIVSYFLPNSLEFVILFFLVAKKNAVSNPLNPIYTRPEMEFYLSDVDADIVVALQSFDHLDALYGICAHLNILLYTISLDNGVFSVQKYYSPCTVKRSRTIDHEIALFLHTSGTTGRPKLVPLKHSNIIRTAQNITMTLDLQRSDATFLVMPLFHVHGLIGALLSSLYSHGTVIIPGKFSARSFWDHFRMYNATWVTAVPTILQILLNQSFDGNIGKLRFIRSCSSSLAPVTLDHLQKKFKVPVVEAYAMTEASHQISSNLRNDVHAGSVGKGRGVEIGIFSLDKDLPLPLTSVGQVCIIGTNVISGYFNNEKANLESFFTDSSNKRWFKTGDLGTLDSNGYLWLKGRIKEMINRAGEKISPLEIDSVLLQHPNVLEAVSFGVNSEIYGQEVEAAVVLNRSITPDDLLKFLDDKLAKFKIPKRIHVAKSLPKTSTGKIQRRVVAEAFTDNKSRL